MIRSVDRRVSSWKASRWFAHLRSAELSDTADHAFRLWLTQSPRNEEEFERQELIWEMLGELKNDSDITQLGRNTTSQYRKEYIRRPWQRSGSLAAAACLIAALAAVLYFARRTVVNAPSAVAQVYATRIGEQRRVILEDGSQVELNTGTQLRVRFTSGSRRLVLERGEAIFYVEHDAARPFIVVAGDTVTRDVGTNFDILYADNRADISVISGRVQADATIGPPSRRQVLLGAGETTTYTPAGGFGSVESANLARIASWQKHRIEFDDSTLLRAVSDFNRYITKKIVVGDPAINSIRVSGVFRCDDAAAFVTALHDTFGIRSEMQNGTYILLPPADPQHAAL